MMESIFMPCHTGCGCQIVSKLTTNLAYLLKITNFFEKSKQAAEISRHFPPILLQQKNGFNENALK